MLGAWDECQDVSGWQVSVEFRPLGVWVVDQFAVYHHFWCQSVKDVRWSESVVCWAVDLRCEYDAVITDANFDDVGYAVFSASNDFFFTDSTRCVCNVDGVFANAFAETFQASGRTARFNNWCWEIGVCTESFGNDRSVRQNSRRTCNLNVVTCSSCGRGNGSNCQGRSGQFDERHI